MKVRMNSPCVRSSNSNFDCIIEAAIGPHAAHGDRDEDSAKLANGYQVR